MRLRALAVTAVLAALAAGAPSAQAAAAPTAKGGSKLSMAERVERSRADAARVRPAAKPAAVAAANGAAATQVVTKCGNRPPAPTPPGGAPYETWSRYIHNADLYDMGFYQGCASDQQRGSAPSLAQFVILDFADPGRGGDGRYGAWPNRVCTDRSAARPR
jgi:hypothetical protein